MGDVRALAPAGESLYVLLGDSLEVYQPSHEVYLPQIADGLGASTLIAIVNLSQVVNSGNLEFLDNSGNPLSIEVVGQTGPISTLDFTLQPGGAVNVQTAGDSAELTSGWVRVTGNRPLTATSVFQYSDQEVILFEAGVGDSPATGSANLFVTRVSPSAASQVSTGIAFANPSDEAANVAIEFHRKLPSSVTLEAGMALEPGAHIAEFVEELFPGDAGIGSEGYLIIRSDIPISLTALRTQNGFQMSSYPVGIPGR